MNVLHPIVVIRENFRVDELGVDLVDFHAVTLELRALAFADLVAVLVELDGLGFEALQESVAGVERTETLRLERLHD